MLSDNSAVTNVLRDITAALTKMSRHITAEDLGRASIAALAKTAAATVMSQSVPGDEESVRKAHKDIMQSRGGSQPPHRYGRKAPQRIETE